MALEAIAATRADVFSLADIRDIESMGLLSSWALRALLVTSRDSAPPFVRSTVLEELPTGLNHAIHAMDQLPFSVPPAECTVQNIAIGLTERFASRLPCGRFRHPPDQCLQARCLLNPIRTGCS
jgi:hypothetical protein